jgi:hypothetical protein
MHGATTGIWIIVVVVVAGLVVWLSAIGLAARHRHGRPRSWMLVNVAIAALYAGGIAVITHLWALCWACAGMMVLAVAVGKAIGVDDSAAVDPDRAPGPSAAGGTRQARARLDCVPMTGVVASDVKARRAAPCLPHRERETDRCRSASMPAESFRITGMTDPHGRRPGRPTSPSN